MKTFITLFASLFIAVQVSNGQEVIPDSTNNLNTASVSTDQLPLIKIQKEIKLITSKIDLDKEELQSLKILVKEYAHQSNPLRRKKERTLDQDFQLKELETKYRFEIRQFLGEDRFKKLLVEDPVE